MTIFAVLEQDHASLRALLSKVDEARDGIGQGGALEALFHEIRIVVLVHTRAEEDTFYAALQAIDATEEGAEHAVDEHETIEALLAVLDTLEVGAPEWRAAYARLHAALLHHIEGEEGALFAAARAVLDDAAQHRLARAFEAERQRLLDDGATMVVRKTA
jgi:hypothetical protein